MPCAEPEGRNTLAAEKDDTRFSKCTLRADPEVIEAAYRRLARKHHPDVNRGPAAAQRLQKQ